MFAYPCDLRAWAALWSSGRNWSFHSASSRGWRRTLGSLPGNKLDQSSTIVAVSGMGSRSIAWTRSEAAGRSPGRISGSTASCNSALVEFPLTARYPSPHNLYATGYCVLVMAKSGSEHIGLRYLYPIVIGLPKPETKIPPGRARPLLRRPGGVQQASCVRGQSLNWACKCHATCDRAIAPVSSAQDRVALGREAIGY